MKLRELTFRVRMDPLESDIYHEIRRFFFKSIGLAVFGLFPFMNPCDISASKAIQNAGNAEEENVMQMAKLDKNVHAAIPPMDNLAPSQMKTATFALG